MSDSDFFREATLRICGSLEIEKALHACFLFLRKRLPLDRVILESCDMECGAMRTIAAASSSGGEALDTLTVLSDEAKSHDFGVLPETHGVFLINAPGEHPISREMLDFHKVSCTALMVMPLVSGGHLVGHLVCLTEGSEPYTAEHARVISLLREPFTIALSNTLKHRSELKLHDREFFWEASQRICGSLNIEKALWQSLLFLRKHMPAEEAALLYFDPAKGAVTLNVHADVSEGRLVNLEVAYPKEMLALMEDVSRLEDFVANRAEEHPVARPMLAAMGKGRSSILAVRLIVESTWVGTVAVWAEGWDRFNDEQLRLMKELKHLFFIALSNSRRYRELQELKDLLADDNRYLHEELQKISGDEIVGADFGLKEVMANVRRVAGLSSPVLLLGETGVGKEVIAGAIHHSSPRRNGPFIKVNCGAIPETLLDSELFGHEKGAFTGAVAQKRGRVERAHGGTLFLDEIGELPPEAQVRLLRVLQEKEIERVGGTETVKVDIRVVAATHRDLQAMIREGTFREDLYFRLQVFPISIPTLRERAGDIPGLVQHFIRRKARDMKLSAIPALIPGAYDQLLSYHWPGNIRELENAVERAIILNPAGPLSFPDLVSKGDPERAPAGIPAENEVLSIDRVTADHISRVLKMTGGRVEGDRGAAALLGINPGTLRHRMRKLGIPFGKKR